MAENSTPKKRVNSDFVTKQHMFGVFRILIMKQNFSYIHYDIKSMYLYSYLLSINIFKSGKSQCTMGQAQCKMGNRKMSTSPLILRGKVTFTF